VALVDALDLVKVLLEYKYQNPPRIRSLFARSARGLRFQQVNLSHHALSLDGWLGLHGALFQR